ncbi:MAG: HAMP domain-containing protein, partial [Gammaproteobacteria bacterium]|nr:HAMP domain-containing protein [Gammaproteobacteria bacterium]
MLIFNSFQARLTLFIVSLLVFSLTATLIAVNNVSIKNTNNEINHSLQISSDVFKNQLTQNQDKLFEIARLLSSDYAFKSAYSTRDRNTILSAMENHLSRVNGDNIMMLVSLDGKIIAHTLNKEIKNNISPWPQLQSTAENNEYGEATSIVLVDKHPFQIMVVPLLIPDLDAWIYIGFPIDDEFVNKINKITRTEVTITHKATNTDTLISGSTLELDKAEILRLHLQKNHVTFDHNLTIEMLGEEYISLPIKLNTITGITLTTVLQRSLSDALKAYNQLRDILFIIFTISLITSIILAFFIARQITHPVKLLTEGAELNESGIYDHDIDVKRNDEIGLLADSFNSMAKGLAEKEKVRNLLGKVVSPEIAEELLKKEIVLGGEEKFVTILFCDVRNFTSLCEGRRPEEILSLLNEYFTKTCGKIESNGGVVDKYIGDAVMAIFGAPIQKDN